MNFCRLLMMAAALSLLGATAQAQHHAMGSAAIAPGYNNPLYQANGFGTGYNNPLNQANGFGTGFNNPLQQNMAVNALNGVGTNQGGRVGGYNAGLGYGVGVGYGVSQGYGAFGGWNSYYQGYGYGGGYYNPMMQGGMVGPMNQAGMVAGNGNPVIPNGVNPAGIAADAGGPRSDPAATATLNGSKAATKRSAHSKASKTTKRKASRP